MIEQSFSPLCWDQGSDLGVLDLGWGLKGQVLVDFSLGNHELATVTQQQIEG